MTDDIFSTVSTLLHEKKKTLALAESCTGGLIAKRITDIPGASEILWGGVTAYTNDAKIKLLGVSEDLLNTHSAVSSPVAAAMAEGILSRSGADFGLSVTGYCGGENAGVAYAALASKDFGTLVTEIDVGKERERGRSIAAEHALDLLLGRIDL